ncbi:hypothetical protein [Ensifer aridi]|uniref:hypothetical protein n=1 Tax=Ensifer aridi TaxID=1708715 RepID=UPI00111C3F84|nr:hypothetical protein [Ensifer aridi]
MITQNACAWLFTGRRTSAENARVFVDERETLPRRLLLTIGQGKVFLTANFKSPGRAAAYLPAHRGRKVSTGRPATALKENKGD